MTTPLVSVIMTVYNGERFLANAIESIRRQTLDNFELVVVDDGSEDDSGEIMSGFSHDHRVRTVSAPRLGRARALNLAWNNARANFIAVLDADDEADPERLELQLDFLRQNPQIGLLGTNWRSLNLDAEYPYPKTIGDPPNGDPELRRALGKYNPFCHSSVMMPRHVLQAMGGYNEKFQVAIDYELWVRISGQFQMANLHDVLVTTRSYRESNFDTFPIWRKYKTCTRIRWTSWLINSRKPSELLYVLHPLNLPRHFVSVNFPQAAALYKRMAHR